MTSTRQLRENQRRFAETISEYFDLRFGQTGKSDGAGNFDPNASIGLPDGQTWVLLDGERDSIPCDNLSVNPYSPGIDVKTEISRLTGRRAIRNVFQREGSGVSATILRQAAVPVPLQFDADKIAIGKVEPATDRGGAWIFVRAFNHDGGAFLPGERQYYELDTEIAAITSGASVMVIVGVDTATNAISVTVGTEKSLIYGYTAEDAEDIATAAGIVRLAALVLRSGQTLATDCFGQNPPRYFDQRQFLNLPGGDAGLPDFGTGVVKTIASGVITAGDDRHIIAAAESSTTDDLIEISGLAVGEEVVVRPDSGDTITLIHNSGSATDKIILYNGANLALTGDQTIKLMKIASGKVVQYVDQADLTIGALVYEKWDVDAPPASPHASDDEFDGAVSGSWTDYDHGSVMTYAASSYGNGVRMVHAQATQSLAGLLRAAPVGDFSMVTHVRASSAPANRIVALLLAEGTASSSKIYAWLISGAAAGSDATLQLHYSTAYNTFSSSIFSYQIGGVGLAMGAFLRVRRISTTYYFDFSMDGKSWYRYNTNSLSNLSALNYIGIGGATNDAGAGDLITTFDFFRVSTNTDLDTPIHGQLVGMYAPP